ncbi:MAG: hypothetical protein KGI64_06065 [Xanthomonadaceae bacterium]|nr:hypothetical protein [Xanthomonadaceae bacterium]MDE1885576.1 hypothetical protein [Xanthomonadaceae bacterium]MDE1961252.1 hypothetical protein [Xanthomonadaceae bacterium]MDE2084409.1 hypothetical protein [Xanthomonadaceae bacterium]MDE2256219.1 hypothetical protein [Xanthomonadaceae bacterium]
MPARNDHLRRRVALEAARLISEHGLRDFHAAKRKAAERLDIRDEAGLPKNSEVEEALREHQRLFHGDDQPRRLRALREAACEAMRYFARFEPRLVGPVLDGTADTHSAVCLHLFCDTIESVIVTLNDDGVNFEEDSRRLRLDTQRSADFPVLRIRQAGVEFDLTLLPLDAIRQAPLDRGGERPLQRAALSAVEKLLRDTET